MGIDLDERCAKMTSINLILRELSGTTYCDNSLTGEMYTRWVINHGWITGDDEPAAINSISAPDKDSGEKLSLL